MLIRGFDTGFRVRGFQVWGFGYGVVEVPVRLFLLFVRGFRVSGFRVRGSGFLVLYSGFSRFGVSRFGGFG